MLAELLERGGQSSVEHGERRLGRFGVQLEAGHTSLLHQQDPERSHQGKEVAGTVHVVGSAVQVLGELHLHAALEPLAALAPGSTATIVRLAEHDGELLHWFYEQGFVPGAEIQLDAAEPAAGQFRVRVAGTERAIGEKAAAGLFVRSAGRPGD